MWRFVCRFVALLLAFVAIASVGLAQRYRVREGLGVPLRIPGPQFEDGAFTHCKIIYRSVVREANGMGWSTDYPFAGINLMIRLKELTKTSSASMRPGIPTTGSSVSPTTRCSDVPLRWPLTWERWSFRRRKWTGCGTTC